VVQGGRHQPVRPDLGCDHRLGRPAPGRRGKPHLASHGPDGDTAHTDVYALGSTSLRDITSGSNGRCGAECTAGPGYDTVTGLGSPIAGVDAALAALK